MYLLALAFNNLRLNIKRTLSLICIVAIALTSIILYQGYVEYCAQGMMAGYVNNCGHLQIAKPSYWNSSDEDSCYINSNELYKIYKTLKNSNSVKFYDTVISFNGLIGNNDTTAIFWGKGFDHPEKYYCPQQGNPVFEDDETVILGKNLVNKVHLDFGTDTCVSVMANSPVYGICLASVDLAGVIDTGIPQNDEGLFITSRKNALNILEMDDCASYVQVYMTGDDYKDFKIYLDKEFKNQGLELLIKDWEELNPSYKQVNNLNKTQFFMISIILGILVFIALLQTLSTAYLERLGEFGTYEAIGLNKQKIGLMLCMETFYIILLGSVFALILSFSANWITHTFNITMNPPGYDTSYELSFCLLPKQILKAISFVFISCCFATVWPVFYICKNSSIKLINHK